MSRLPHFEHQEYQHEFMEDGTRRFKSSIFLVTVNTNTKPLNKDDETEIGENLRDATTALFDNHRLSQFVKYYKKNPSYDKNKEKGPNNPRIVPDPNGRWDIDYIHGAYYSDGYETGPKERRVHTHIFVNLEHFSYVQLDPRAIQEAYNEYFRQHYPRIQNVYVNVRGFPSTPSSRTYVTKADMFGGKRK
jgi:hypothetical protein